MGPRVTLRPDLLLAHDFGATRHDYSVRDAILYALGVGLGSDPTDEAELSYLDESRLAVLPTFAVTLASPGMWIRDPRFDVTFSQLLHSAQDATFGAPLPASGAIVGTARVAAIGDRGEGRGADLVLERELRSVDGTTLFATLRQTLLLRGDGGFGGEPLERAPQLVPARTPDLVTGTRLSRRAALIYRLSGDWNPLHVDPAFARSAGFDRPIMHGLGTYATVGITVAKAIGASPLSIRRLACRFSGVTYPGDELSISIWTEPGQTIFVAHAGERKVIDQGVLEVSQ